MAVGATPADTSVPGIMLARWRVRPEISLPRLAEGGWSYDGPCPAPCPTCAGALHTLRRPYVSGGRQYRYVALVCPSCPAAFTLADLGLKTYDDLLRAHGDPPKDTVVPLLRACREDTGPGVRVTAVRAGDAAAYARALLDPALSPRAYPPVAEPPVYDARLLDWVKYADPSEPRIKPGPGHDMRVILPESPGFDPVVAEFEADGVAVRRLRYWVEHDHISTLSQAGARGPLTACSVPILRPGVFAAASAPYEGWRAAAGRDAFEMLWQATTPEQGPPPPSMPAADLLPAAWLGYLPYPVLNPAQAQAIPRLLADRSGSPGHIVVVAPTGAGKTCIGMVAALQTILGEGRKAAWLVPQRSLTDELDRDLELWRRQGLRVQRLSGEYAVDAQRIREADLWVATTEKFEALCRTASLRDAIIDVGSLVVDEIHLLGDETRGPVLEALLARVRDADPPVRIVGLSATVSNAADVADWLGAELVTTTWRPTRLTWQLPTICAMTDWKTASAARTRVAVELTEQVTADGGSVLVFCGSKRNLRATALAIAEARGAHTTGVDIDDTEAVYRACHSARVGLHYRDWEHKREAEAAFRARTYDVLVATTTVAAGVNLPARAVIVRDTTIGLDPLGVSTVQQMFGRAGRVGAGETEGWAFLIVDEVERPFWQSLLVSGYTVRSKIADALEDHLLAELVQERVVTTRGAQAWWVRTLGYHQGGHDPEVVGQALDALTGYGYATCRTRDDGQEMLAATDLGTLTARLMIPVLVGEMLRAELEQCEVPDTARAAEWHLIRVLAEQVPQLAQAPVAENLRAVVTRLATPGALLATNDDDGGGEQGALLARPSTGLATTVRPAPGDLAKAVLQTLIDKPRAFAGSPRAVLGIPASTMFPILEEAPRYLAWLAAQGYLDTVHPWIAVAAADLGRRIRWRRLAPARGAGRLLWMLEQMATPLHVDGDLPQLWRAASDRAVTNPDWPPGAAPRGCRLEHDDYVKLLRERATGTSVAQSNATLIVSGPPGAVVARWLEDMHGATPLRDEALHLHVDTTTPHTAQGAVAFTRRGDYHASGWLSAYNDITGA